MRYIQIFQGFFNFFLYISFLPLIALSGCWTFNTSKKLAEAQRKAPYDAIIVPGVPLEDSAWSEVMKIRVHWSKYLYDHKICNNIIYSGSAVYTPFHESKVMRAYAIALGIPAAHIYVDTLAEHSTENLFYSYCLGKSHGFEKIALATDPFQNKMLKAFGRKMAKRGYGPIDFIPMVIDTLKQDSLITPPISLDSLKVSSFTSIKEREGFWERFKGTRGKKINWEHCK